jgi:hypothetical protein
MILCRCDRQRSEAPTGGAVSSISYRCTPQDANNRAHRQQRAISRIRNVLYWGHQVQTYLFRDQGGSNNFAYSGRNIPRPDGRTEWRFESIVTYQNKSPKFEDVIRHLRRVGFYVFER